MKIRKGGRVSGSETVTGDEAGDEAGTEVGSSETPTAGEALDILEDTGTAGEVVETLLRPVARFFEGLLAPIKSGHDKLTQENLNDLLEEFKGLPKPVAFREILEERGYSPRVSGLDFTESDLVGKRAGGVGRTPIMGSDLYHGVDFSGVIFHRCVLMN